MSEGLAAAISQFLTVPRDASDNVAIDAAAAPIADQLSRLPLYRKFAKPVLTSGSGSMHLTPERFAYYVAGFGTEHGAAKAVAFAKHISALTRIDLQVCQLVTGVKTAEVIDAGLGITIHPADGFSIPIGAKAAIEAKLEGPDAIILEAKDCYSPAFSEAGTDQQFPTPSFPLHDKASQLHEVTKLLCLLPSSALYAATWTRTLDPYVEYIINDNSVGGCDHYFKPVNFIIPSVSPDIKQIYDGYRGLSAQAKSIIDVSLERINYAYGRIGPDRALDAAIALEAAVGGKDKQEIGYKLRLRAACLLGESLDDRVQISRIVKNLYALRSKVVHEGFSKFDLKDQSAHEGLLLTCRIVKRLIALGGIPEWERLELSAGADVGKVS